MADLLQKRTLIDSVPAKDPERIRRQQEDNLARQKRLWGDKGTPYAGTSGSSKPATTYTAPTRIATDRGLMSQQDWQTRYGNINFDANAIKGVFDTATAAEYEAKHREYDASERAYYAQVGTEQNSLLDAKRRAAAQNAVQTGANRGMQNAVQLTDLIQKSAADAPTALALAQQRRLLTEQEQAAYTANAKEAEALAEQRKTDYAKIGSEVYATDAQKYVGELGYDAAALESAMTKYGIDKSAVSGGSGSGGGVSATSRLNGLLQLYASASSGNDADTKALAARALTGALIGITP